MSVRVSSRVWERSNAKGGALLLLLALADFSNDRGTCWPGVETLARYCRLTDRAIQYNLDMLETMGEITRKLMGGPNGANLYTLYPGGEKIAPLTSSALEGVQFDDAEGEESSKEGEVGFTEGVKGASPEPSVNHQESVKEPPLGKREKANLVTRLETYFRQRTTLKYPKTKGEQVNTWEKPIAEAYEEVDWDWESGKQLVEIALSRADGKFQVSSPKSIIKTIRAIAAEARTGRGTKEHEGRSAIRDWLEGQQ